MAKKNTCEPGCCTPKCKGMKVLIIGILFLLNAKYGWMTLQGMIGTIMVVLGAMKVLIPNCCCHKK